MSLYSLVSRKNKLLLYVNGISGNSTRPGQNGLEFRAIFLRWQNDFLAVFFQMLYFFHFYGKEELGWGGKNNTWGIFVTNFEFVVSFLRFLGQFWLAGHKKRRISRIKQSGCMYFFSSGAASNLIKIWCQFFRLILGLRLLMGHSMGLLMFCIFELIGICHWKSGINLFFWVCYTVCLTKKYTGFYIKVHKIA